MVRFGGMYGFDFGPFFRSRHFGKGDFKHLILDLLSEKPRHGYEIIKELESRFCGFYSPSPGTIYPTLQMLEEMGWVRSRQEDGKKIYEITAEGEAELKSQEEKVGDIWSRIEDWRSFRMEDLNDLFEDLADLKKFVRFKMRSRKLNREKLQKIRKIVSRAKDEILEVLHSG